MKTSRALVVAVVGALAIPAWFLATIIFANWIGVEIFDKTFGWHDEGAFMVGFIFWMIVVVGVPAVAFGLFGAMKGESR